MKIWERRSTERTSHPTQGDLVGQILVNHRGMLSCRWLIFLCRLELFGRRKTQVKPMAESLQNKVDLLSVGMKTQLPGKLLCLQLGECRNWGESDQKDGKEKDISASKLLPQEGLSFSPKIPRMCRSTDKNNNRNNNFN